MKSSRSMSVQDFALLLGAMVLLAGCGRSAGSAAGKPQNAKTDPRGKIMKQLRDVDPQAMLLFSGRLKPVETDFEDWEYPGATGLESGTGMKRSVTGTDFDWESQLASHMAMSSGDDFETVVTHYATNMNKLLPPSPGEKPPAKPEPWLPESRGTSFKNGVSIVYDVKGRADPKQDGGDRALDIATLVLQAANCSVHVTISRGPEEKATYIHVVYHKWTVMLNN